MISKKTLEMVISLIRKIFFKKKNSFPLDEEGGGHIFGQTCLNLYL